MVALVTESPADQESVRVLVEAVLQRNIQVQPRQVRSGGVDSVLRSLPAVIKEVYFHTDAIGVVAVVDSDRTSFHTVDHEAGASEPACRLCQLLCTVESVHPQLPTRPLPLPLNVALGLAVPAIEAWCLCGVDHGVSETTWINARKANQLPYTPAELKTVALRHGSPLPRRGSGWHQVRHGEARLDTKNLVAQDTFCGRLWSAGSAASWMESSPIVIDPFPCLTSSLSPHTQTTPSWGWLAPS